MAFHGTLFVGHIPISTRSVLLSRYHTMMPEEITSDGDEEILQERESSEPDDISEMEPEDD